ncbi:O-antigen ligase family protein [Pseudocolwellia sp. HL-MZ7]|uniref:O-antigen ligase family protein n=1 Tax=Pseudocolwellia sp. HL-MZ7 TaxID=3400627 RepID=UPI003CEF0CE1
MITIVTVIFTVSALTALHAIINYYTDGGFLYIDTLPPWHASNYKTIHGPLSYKNHYASLLILTIPLGFGLLLSNKSPKHHSKSALVLNFILSKNFILFVASLFMIMVLIFNTSRGGLIAFILGTTITTILFFYIKKIKPKNIYKNIAGLILIFITIIFSGLSDRLFERISNYGENGRDILRTTALNIVIDNPIIGTGPGTYPAIQHKYKPDTLNGNKMWQHVHNDYLELLSNQGIIGILLLGTAISMLIFSLIKGIKSNNSSLLGIQTSCLCSVFCVLIHSLMDFNFQLPVINVYFYIILAVGIRISSIKQSRSHY